MRKRLCRFDLVAKSWKSKNLKTRCKKAALQLNANSSPDLFLLQGYLALRNQDVRAALAILRRGRPLPKAKRAK
jgi:hypothetical protein